MNRKRPREIGPKLGEEEEDGGRVEDRGGLGKGKVAGSKLATKGSSKLVTPAGVGAGSETAEKGGVSSESAGKGGPVSVAAAAGEIDDIFGSAPTAKERQQRQQRQAAAQQERQEVKRKGKQQGGQGGPPIDVGVNPFGSAVAAARPLPPRNTRGINVSEANKAKWAWSDSVRPVRYDDDNLPIYSWDSLRIGRGGGTKDCPFDCGCCF